MAGEDAPPGLHLWMVGPGRLGLSMALALARAGVLERLTISGRAPHPPPHPLFIAPSFPVAYQSSLLPPDPAPTLLLIAVPDDSIPSVAHELASLLGASRPVVLHCSGALGSETLAPLRDAGCEVGSLHPLVALSDSLRGAEALRGAWFAFEGSAVAERSARRLVSAVQGQMLVIEAGRKATYHAAAVFASNYLVALLATAERLAEEAGASVQDARAALNALALSALDGVRERGPVGALTGPIRRGDADTVRLHLARLSLPDAALYSLLGRNTLPIALEGGLDPAAADEIDRVLLKASW